jgi:hypothetical protein
MTFPRLALAFALAFGVCCCRPRTDEPATAPTRPQLEQARVAAAPVAITSAAALAAPEPCAGQAGPGAVTLPERVTFGDFWTALAAQIDRLDTTALRSGFEAFAARHDVDPGTPQLWQDFTRLWVVFEATRDGGWWRLRWDVTDQEPSSVLIWKAWMRTPPAHAFASESAVAECDEITALFSVTARRLGVRGVGLFYPTWNHVIAGWAPEALARPGANNVVLIPTTQIFQGCPSTFDETTFKVPKHVYEFPKVDMRDAADMPRALAQFLLEQVRAYGEASPELLALIRAKRADLLRSSLGDCDAYRQQLATELRPRLTCADRRALRHLTEHELGQHGSSDEQALSFLASP